VIALDRRRGKAENDSALLARARGRYGLLLNEDSELRPGATSALVAALDAAPRAGAAGARLLRPDGGVQPSAFRFPTVWASVLGALGLARLNVQSRGDAVREVDWAHSAAMLVRRAAGEQIGWLDPAFFVYSDEVDFCRRLRDVGWSVLYVPSAEAVHHEQLSTGAGASRRIVEFSRNRDRYVRKHHGLVVAAVVRWLTALAYFERAVAALVLPGHPASRYWRHVVATLRPGRGEGIAEAAAAFNLARDSAEAR
jgi:N-acetylglucosaminyl-diphospho-decaprenol L-rhamnosyltransferase